MNLGQHQFAWLITSTERVLVPGTRYQFLLSGKALKRVESSQVEAVRYYAVEKRHYSTLTKWYFSDLTFTCLDHPHFHFNFS